MEASSERWSSLALTALLLLLCVVRYRSADITCILSLRCCRAARGVLFVIVLRTSPISCRYIAVLLRDACCSLPFGGHRLKSPPEGCGTPPTPSSECVVGGVEINWNHKDFVRSSSVSCKKSWREELPTEELKTKKEKKTPMNI